MSAAAVSTRGQITLPKAIRDKLGLKAGDLVVFRELADGAIVMEVANIELLDLFGSVRPRVRGVTVDQMKDAIRRRAAKNR